MAAIIKNDDLVEKFVLAYEGIVQGMSAWNKEKRLDFACEHAMEVQDKFELFQTHRDIRVFPLAVQHAIALWMRSTKIKKAETIELVLYCYFQLCNTDIILHRHYYRLILRWKCDSCELALHPLCDVSTPEMAARMATEQRPPILDTFMKALQQQSYQVIHYKNQYRFREPNNGPVFAIITRSVSGNDTFFNYYARNNTMFMARLN